MSRKFDHNLDNPDDEVFSGSYYYDFGTFQMMETSSMRLKLATWRSKRRSQNEDGSFQRFVFINYGQRFKFLEILKLF